MLKFISEKSGIEFTYSVQSYAKIKNSTAEEYVGEIFGSMVRYKNGEVNSSFFNFIRNESSDENGLFKGLNLSSPGKNYDEISKEETALWTDINKYAKEFFSLQEQEQTYFTD